MASKNSSRRGSAAPSKTASLAAETAEMEAKLLELRKAMEHERAKREKANADSSHWRSGGAGLLRSNFRSKAPAQGALPPVTPPAQDASQLMTATDTQPSSTHSHQLTSHKSASSTTPDRLLDQQAHITSASHKAGQLTPPSHSLRPDTDTTTARLLGLRASPTQEPASQNLAQGTFDEADSHTSFLEALNEWRAANRGGGSAASIPQPPQSPTTKLVSPSQVVPNSATGMQTDVGSSRPTSAKPVSYFNRLVMSSASRQAGAAAAHTDTTTTTCTTTTATNTTPGSLPTRKSITTLPPLSSHNSSASQVYAVEAAMTSPSHSISGVKHKGLDILEELERLEIQHYRAAQQYDSDEEWAALLSPHPPGRAASRQEAQLVVTTQQGGVGLTKGARLPDAILLPEHDSEHDD